MEFKATGEATWRRIINLQGEAGRKAGSAQTEPVALMFSIVFLSATLLTLLGSFILARPLWGIHPSALLPPPSQSRAAIELDDWVC